MSFPEVFAIFPGVFVFAVAILGLMFGSFLNVVINRLPVMMERQWKAECAQLLESPNAEADSEVFNLFVPRSRCPNCGKSIAAWQNIPVISWLLLRGKCAGCGSSISIQYPAVEIDRDSFGCRCMEAGGELRGSARSRVYLGFNCTGGH